MIATNITTDTIVEVKSVRDQLAERTEVLDKVKTLLMIPDMEVMTNQQIADYFEVPIDTIRQVYQRNKNEIIADGVIKKKQSDFDCDKMSQSKKEGRRGSTTYILSDNTELIIPNCGILCYSKRAVLRIAMLLRDSEIAKEVRTQLLNTFESATAEQRIEAIDNEEEIISEIGKAYASGSLERFAKASQIYVNFQNRHIIALENENKKLNDTNAILTKAIRKWDSRAILNALIRTYASVTYGNNFRLAYNKFYKELYYKKGISLKMRDGKGKLISKIREDEWLDVLQVASAMCESKGLNVGEIINESNLEPITQKAN